MWSFLTGPCASYAPANHAKPERDECRHGIYACPDERKAEQEDASPRDVEAAHVRSIERALAVPQVFSPTGGNDDAIAQGKENGGDCSPPPAIPYPARAHLALPFLARPSPTSYGVSDWVPLNYTLCRLRAPVVEVLGAERTGAVRERLDVGALGLRLRYAELRLRAVAERAGPAIPSRESLRHFGTPCLIYSHYISPYSFLYIVYLGYLERSCTSTCYTGVGGRRWTSGCTPSRRYRIDSEFRRLQFGACCETVACGVTDLGARGSAGESRRARSASCSIRADREKRQRRLTLTVATLPPLSALPGQVRRGRFMLPVFGEVAA